MNIEKKYTEELYKKVLNDSDKKGSVTWISTKIQSWWMTELSDSVDMHLEPDILGKWSQVGLRKHRYEAIGGDGIPAELLQVLKDDAVKVLYSICQQNCSRRD